MSESASLRPARVQAEAISRPPTAAEWPRRFGEQGLTGKAREAISAAVLLVPRLRAISERKASFPDQGVNFPDQQI